MTSDLIADIWTIMVEHIDEKKKQDVQQIISIRY